MCHSIERPYYLTEASVDMHLSSLVLFKIRVLSSRFSEATFPTSSHEKAYQDFNQYRKTSDEIQ